MKCLLFLYGEYRTFPTAVKTWNILDIPNLDIVVHTPNTSSDFRFSEDYKIINETDFKVLDNPKIFFYDRDEYSKKYVVTCQYSYNFLNEYLDYSETEYDYIFIGRLDSEFYLKDYQSFISEPRSSLFAISTPYISEDTCFIPDHTFFGNSAVVKKFLSNMPITKNRLESHYDLAIYINDNFECETWNNFDSVHIRPNMTHLFENYFKDKKIKNIDESYEKFMKDEFFPNHIQLEDEYYRNYRNDI